MALSPPSRAQLLAFTHETAFDNDAWADQALQQATDLMTIATSLTAYPTDATEARIVTNGILAMAQYLLVTDEDREALYSGFSGERIGSYSYTKATQRVVAGEGTGVPWFDTAVLYLGRKENPDDAFAGGWSTSEKVFPMPYRDEPTTVAAPDVFGR